jgi:predicted transcriptional regulator
MYVRDTSIDAYNTIRDRGLLTRLHWDVYDTLYQYGPITSGECHHRLKKQRRVDIATVRARITELSDMGYVRTCGKRVCAASSIGATCYIWGVTSLKRSTFRKEKTPEFESMKLRSLWRKGTPAERKALVELWQRTRVAARRTVEKNPSQLELSL